MEHEDPHSEWSAVADALEQAKNDEGEDPPPFDFVSKTGLIEIPTEKIPLEQSANLMAMREAAHLIRHDEISLDDYLARIKKVATVAENGIKLFSSEVLKKEAEKLPPEQLVLVQAFEKQIYVLKEGTDLMALYAHSGQIDDLDKGLGLVELAMRAVDQVQDKALDIAAAELKAKAEADAQAKAEEARAAAQNHE